MTRWRLPAPVLLLLPAIIVLAAVVLVPLLLSLWSSFTAVQAHQARDLLGLRRLPQLRQHPHRRRLLGRLRPHRAAAHHRAQPRDAARARPRAAGRARRPAASALLRTLMMFPMMFSPILVGFQFKFLFNDNIGLVNNALQALGLTDQAIPWLIDGTLAFIAILVAEVWSSTSVFAILILAGPPRHAARSRSRPPASTAAPPGRRSATSPGRSSCPSPTSP